MKKQQRYDDPAANWLRKLSKAALADCVIDLLREISGSCDDPIEVKPAVERLKPILQMRGDQIPQAAILKAEIKLAAVRGSK